MGDFFLINFKSHIKTRKENKTLYNLIHQTNNNVYIIVEITENKKYIFASALISAEAGFTISTELVVECHKISVLFLQVALCWQGHKAVAGLLHVTLEGWHTPRCHSDRPQTRAVRWNPCSVN